jgi:predicted DNA-binding protein with PD1-like motif
MKSKLLADEVEKTYALVFDAGEEVISGLLKFVTENQLTASYFTAIGALKEVTLGYFNIEKRDYKRIPLREQVEVLSLMGNVAIDGGKPRIHAHIVVGKSDGTAHGGHLIEAMVRPTLEVILKETPGHLRRKTDPISGLALFDLSSS